MSRGASFSSWRRPIGFLVRPGRRETSDGLFVVRCDQVLEIVIKDPSFDGINAELH